MALPDPAHQRDLGEREAGGLGVIRRDISREELSGELAGLHARDVGVGLGMDLAEVIGREIALRRRVETHDERQVVVAVDQRDAIQQSERLAMGGVGEGRGGEDHDAPGKRIRGAGFARRRSWQRSAPCARAKAHPVNAIGTTIPVSRAQVVRHRRQMGGMSRDRVLHAEQSSCAECAQGRSIGCLLHRQCDADCF
jgi:hypothetical protein